MTSEELEFNICQYLDGTLVEEQRIALEALLERDAGARELLAEHRRLDEAMKASSAMPRMRWDKLADHLSKAVEFGPERLEQTVVEYVDGDLSADERADLEHRLVDDPYVSSLVRQHGQLRSALRSMPMPAVQWNKLAEHLSDVVAEAADPKPLKISGYSWMRTVGGLAVAACVMLVMGLALHQHRQNGSPVAVVPKGNNKVSVISVAFDTSQPTGAAVTDISIGAGSNVASVAPAEYADGIVVMQPSRGLIATSAGPAQDIQTPY
jgi:anti-sigma-K factor RskA